MEAITDTSEEKVTCPYNPAHRISRKRLQLHLTKCGKQHSKVKTLVCDFDVTHIVLESEIQYHHNHCPSRRDIEPYIYQEEGTTVEKFPVVNIEIDTSESWDCENTGTYNPEAYCESHPVLRHLDVEPESKRKNFRISERRRLNNLNNQPNVPEMISEGQYGHTPNVQPRPIPVVVSGPISNGRSTGAKKNNGKFIGRPGSAANSKPGFSPNGKVGQNSNEKGKSNNTGNSKAESSNGRPGSSANNKPPVVPSSSTKTEVPESKPDEIRDLVERIHIGKRKSYIPKQ